MKKIKHSMIKTKEQFENRIYLSAASRKHTLTSRIDSLLESKDGKRYSKKMEAHVAILISDRKDFNIKLIRIDREGYYIFIKGKIHQEGIEVLNIYVPNTRAPKFL